MLQQWEGGHCRIILPSQAVSQSKGKRRKSLICRRREGVRRQSGNSPRRAERRCWSVPLQRG